MQKKYKKISYLNVAVSEAEKRKEEKIRRHT
jgi:hypothetical protein